MGLSGIQLFWYNNYIQTSVAILDIHYEVIPTWAVIQWYYSTKGSVSERVTLPDSLSTVS